MRRILLFLLMCASSSVANAMAVPGVARGEDVEDKPVAAMNKEVANQLLMDGARDGNLNLVQTALVKGADVNHVGSITVPIGTIANITPLVAASLHNNHEVVRLLIERGADVNKKAGPWVATPLMEAVGLDAREIAELLLDAGAELEARDQEGKTALWYAIFDRHPEMVQLLIEHGASMWTANNYGMTPYVWIDGIIKGQGETIERWVREHQRELQRFGKEANVFVQGVSQFQEKPLPSVSVDFGEYCRHAGLDIQRIRNEQKIWGIMQPRAREARGRMQGIAPQGETQSLITDRFTIERLGREFRRNRDRIQALRVLGLDQSASDADIRKRWRALLSQCDRDRNSGVDMSDVTIIINDAYEFLME